MSHKFGSSTKVNRVPMGKTILLPQLELSPFRVRYRQPYHLPLNERLHSVFEPGPQPLANSGIIHLVPTFPSTGPRNHKLIDTKTISIRIEIVIHENVHILHRYSLPLPAWCQPKVESKHPTWQAKGNCSVLSV